MKSFPSMCMIITEEENAMCVLECNADSIRKYSARKSAIIE